MIIHNRMTNNLHLVETIQVGSGVDLFLRTFSASQDCTLEVFRNERHLASITPETLSRRWDVGMLVMANTVLKVSHGYRTLMLLGQLHTLDGFTRDYEIEVQLHISNSTLFATQYHQRSDPIALAQKTIETILNRYAQQHLHNDINHAQLLELANTTFSPATHRRTGVAIDDILRIDVRLDSRHGQVLTSQQDIMVDEARIARETHIADLEFRSQTPLQHARDAYEIERTHQMNTAKRHEDERQREHERWQDEAQKHHDRRQDELQRHHERNQYELQKLQEQRMVLQEAYLQGIGQSILEQFARGYTPKEIWDEHPELRSAFQGIPQLQPGGATTDPSRALPEQSSNSSSFKVKEQRPQGVSNSRTEEDVPSFRISERRQIINDNTGEIIEVTPKPISTHDAAYEPIIRVKAQRQDHTETEPIADAENQGQDSSFRCDHLSITLVTVSEEERRLLDLDPGIVLVVQTVDPNGPAHKGSILRGDFIVEINQQAVSTTQSLLRILSGCADGTVVSVRVLRMGQLINLPGITITTPG